MASIFMILLMVISGFSSMAFPAFADSVGPSVGPGVPSDSPVLASGGIVGPLGTLLSGDYVYVGRLAVPEDHTRQYFLSMFNRASGAFVKNIPVADIGADQPDYAQALYAISPDGTKVYAACPGNILEIDANTGDCTNHTGIVHYQCDLAVSPSGLTLYVADYDYQAGENGGSLLLVDTGTFNVLSRIDSSVYPGFAFDLLGSRYLVSGQDRVYFAAYNFTGLNSTILEFDVSDPSNPRLGRS